MCIFPQKALLEPKAHCLRNVEVLIKCSKSGLGEGVSIVMSNQYFKCGTQKLFLMEEREEYLKVNDKKTFQSN